LQIHPANLELVKLTPMADGEGNPGKFPELIRVPDPQPPPRASANHEAPAKFREGWEKSSNLMQWFRKTKTAIGDVLGRDVN
jgi:hypothetical protein